MSHSTPLKLPLDIIQLTAHEHFEELREYLPRLPFHAAWQNEFGHFDRGVAAATQEAQTSFSCVWGNYEMVVVRHTLSRNLVLFRNLHMTSHTFFAIPTGVFDDLPAGKVRTGWVQDPSQKLMFPVTEFQPIPGIHLDYIRNPNEAESYLMHLLHDAKSPETVLNC